MYVARHNTTFKLADVEKLFKEAKVSITQAKWAKACDHVIANVERKFWEVEFYYPYILFINLITKNSIHILINPTLSLNCENVDSAVNILSKC